MTIVDAIFLGIIQGVTEFLPVSSTGHLVLAREAFGYGDLNGLAFDAVLQLATSLAILIYFWKDFSSLFVKFFQWISGREGDYSLVKAMIFGSIPAAFLGLLFESKIETIFRSSLLIAFALIFGSILFYVAEKYGRQNKEISPRKGFFIGWFQALALIPGISRSGSTLSGGLLLGLTRVEAARFSFLLSFPIIFGAGIYKLMEIFTGGSIEEMGVTLLCGSLSSFLFGIISIHYLLVYLKNHSLKLFIYYRLILAFFILALHFA